MSGRRQIPPLFVAILLTPATLVGQDDDHRFGLNFRIAGTGQVGVTYALAPSLLLRPALLFNRQTLALVGVPPNVQDVTITEAGLDLDLLLPVGARGRLLPYLGAGGQVLGRWVDGESVTNWAARGLFGVRVTVFERLAVFGEFALEYSESDGVGFFGPSGNRLALAAAPLGVLVFLD